ncbi:uncharacterized protein METZ01_LOCUS261123, partial [marine metagenome]
MQLRKISYIKLFITFFITTISFARVTLEIKNVDLSANTLDIYMKNVAGCSYCSDPLYDNQNGCESYGSSNGGITIDGVWSFNTWMEEDACGDVNGDYFDGDVGGFQIIIPDITVTGASGGSAEDADLTVQTSDNKASKIIGFSVSGGVIPAGDALLTTLTFSAVSASGSICIPFQEDCSITGNPNNCVDLASDIGIDSSDDNPVISDTNGEVIALGELLCWCGSDSNGGDQYIGCDDVCSLTPALIDCFGECGGSAVLDECDVCNGTGPADGYGCDGNVLSIIQVNSYLPDEFAISQNFPNPFNPV